MRAQKNEFELFILKWVFLPLVLLAFAVPIFGMLSTPPIVEHLELKFWEGKHSLVEQEINLGLKRDRHAHWAYAFRALLSAHKGNFAQAKEDIMKSATLRYSITWVGNKRNHHDCSRHIEFIKPKKCHVAVSRLSLSDRSKKLLSENVCKRDLKSL